MIFESCYNKYMKNNNVINILIFVLFILIYLFFEYNINQNNNNYVDNNDKENIVVVNNNEPNFNIDNFENISFEEYGELDSLGRCTYAYANIGKDLMPTEKREDISNIKPTGWHSVKYDFIEDDGHLFNRCHLIAHQLTAENANKRNLITCTKYTNSVLMTKYEIIVGNYIRKTNNHVLYRVTPIFEEDNLIASRIQIEAFSVEDNGIGVKFNVLINNVQPGVLIDYKTGKSKVYSEE